MKLVVLLLFVGLAFCTAPDQNARDAVTNAHNSARGDAIPTPLVALNDLAYDLNVEGIASAYADLCVYQHSTGTGLGENLYAASVDLTQSGDIASVLTAATTAWEAEEDDYTLTTSGDSCSAVCGHYTQMVWDSTTTVGCGYAVCNTGSPFGSGTWTYVVCNYSPPGNFIGEIPYEPVADSCDLATECGLLGFECGSASVCGGTFSCGSCDAGFECNNNVCETATGPCANCGINTECVNDQCVCLSGFVLVGGICELADPGEPNVSGQFTQTEPLGQSNFIDEGNALELVQGGLHVIRWDRSSAFFTQAYTRIQAEVHQNDGYVGLGAFHGQPENENDMLKWQITNISGGFGALRLCIGRHGSDFCSGAAPISFSLTPHTLTMEVFQISGTQITTTFQVDDDYIWSATTDLIYFPNTGSIALEMSPVDDTPTLSKISLFNDNDVVQLDLYGCLDNTQWQTVYNNLGGAGTAPSRSNGENGCCDCNTA